jgi:hypothetical protein
LPVAIKNNVSPQTIYVPILNFSQMYLKESQIVLERASINEATELSWKSL